ncbi:hypothetical protein UNSWDHB_2612 [Dehalobacter sp. UNSWDHB]|uniref:DUF6273 domain-containing protein n=1 Tax=Dehalobacter sp. UNSWDHB TaxID=1339256 RepID=UPI0003877893|nr:DUF6273 domain-containing protein [Dehalobacter sp. UNSWDHB]EQB20026.1 hypothetical protein UNSWDHB_2612 [Dehalobacter sp. UNSWDHB]
MPQAMSALAVGAKIEIPVKSGYQSQFGTKIVFRVADKNHSGYPANSVTLITDKIIQLLAFDAKEPSNANSDRQNYGNNNYNYSNLRQWLNSNAAAGAWYSAKHAADASPASARVSDNAYDTRAGFLAIFDTPFVNALLNTTLTVVKNTVTDGGSYETVTDKIFLASTTETGLANENGIAEGSILSWFNTAANRITQCTQAAIDTSTYASDPTTSAAWYWWLRTPNSSNARNVRSVNTDGTLDISVAYYGYLGVRPLCNLSSAILVSDTTNGDGNYEVIWNTAPSAPASITVPATIYSGQTINVSWPQATDPDGDALTYVLERSYNGGGWTQVQNSAARTFSETVSASWNTIKYRVKAVDPYSNASGYTTSGDVAVSHNQPPVISGNNADLGVKSTGFTYGYSITDADGDIVNVVEKIDGVNYNTRNSITLGAPITFSISGNDFTAISNDEHTISIVATDTAGNNATRTLTFTKLVTGFVITLAAPLPADEQPKRCSLKINREIPAGGSFLVEVCNNPFDVSPVWEDCTSAVIAGFAHVFENTVNTALEHGFNVRVTVDRGGAITPCWVSGIGGNFE